MKLYENFDQKEEEQYNKNNVLLLHDIHHPRWVFFVIKCNLFYKGVNSER